MTVKPFVQRDYFTDPDAWPDISFAYYWHWSHDTAECFDISSSDRLYDTMQAAFSAAHYHLQEECETNDR